MKKFFEGIMAWKTPAAFMFAGSVILYGMVSLLLGKREVSIAIIASLLVLSALGSFLQLFAFSEHIIKYMRYSLRLVLFGIPFLALLAGIAFVFEWFPIESGGAWLSFVIIFLIIFIGTIIGFEVYYRVMGKKYDGLLGQYRKQREQG
jgi:hypothetical protein